jgi:hypothetical protein
VGLFKGGIFTEFCSELNVINGILTVGRFFNDTSISYTGEGADAGDLAEDRDGPGDFLDSPFFE